MITGNPNELFNSVAGSLNLRTRRRKEETLRSEIRSNYFSEIKQRSCKMSFARSVDHGSKIENYSSCSVSSCQHGTKSEIEMLWIDVGDSVDVERGQEKTEEHSYFPVKGSEVYRNMYRITLEIHGDMSRKEPEDLYRNEPVFNEYLNRPTPMTQEDKNVAKPESCGGSSRKTFTCKKNCSEGFCSMKQGSAAETIPPAVNHSLDVNDKFLQSISR